MPNYLSHRVPGNSCNNGIKQLGYELEISWLANTFYLLRVTHRMCLENKVLIHTFYLIILLLRLTTIQTVKMKIGQFTNVHCRHYKTETRCAFAYMFSLQIFTNLT